ncbi:MAG: helix-turn-helix domain-containing protein [Streptosporangiales bacterium]|nr:helix-turn-helix domain-containing protein [Streptosporangiales bacterium]
MIKKMGYRWHLRRLMADAEMFQTSELVPRLAERGVHLSREQVYRLVTQPPQRLSMEVLPACRSPPSGGSGRSSTSSRT